MKLQQIQHDFQDIVLTPECRGANWVCNTTQDLSPVQRLSIYHNAYRLRLIDVLFDTYEHTAHYLGEEWFEKLAGDFVQLHHSTHNNIGQYGEIFPDFLAKELPNDLEIAELALMDWTLRRAFDGYDCQVMTQQHLQQIANGECSLDRLQPVPTVRLLTQCFNTLDIWQAINQEQEQVPAVEQLAQPVAVMIWRKAHAPHFQSLSLLETTAAQCLLKQASLETIGAAISQAFPEEDAAKQVGQLLHHWIAEQILAWHDPHTTEPTS